MEFTVVQSELKNALDIVKRQAPTRSTLQILSCCKITAGEGLTLTATDLSAYIEKTIPAKVQREGTVCIPVQLLSEFITSLSNDVVTITQKKSKVSIKCGRFEANINSLPSDEYPEIPRVEPTFELDAEIIKNAVNKIAYAAAKDDARPTLCGMLIDADADGLKFACADGFRLSAVKAQTDAQLSVLPPARYMRELVKLIGGTVKVGVGNSMLAFESAGITMGIGLIEGKFPDISRVTPRVQDATTKATVAVAELMRAAKSAGIFARNNAIKLDIHDGGIVVTAIGSETGDNRGEIDAKVVGPALTIGVNHQYLMEMLAVQPTETTFYLTSKSQPLMAIPDSDPAFISLAMPMNAER